jgi:hypothetical protein
MKCVACGGEELVEGVLFDKAYTSEVGFKASGSSMLNRMFGTGVMSVGAFGCVRCGHLQLGVELSERLLEEHQSFDKAPPSVTE